MQEKSKDVPWQFSLKPKSNLQGKIEYFSVVSKEELTVSNSIFYRL